MEEPFKSNAEQFMKIVLKRLKGVSEGIYKSIPKEISNGHVENFLKIIIEKAPKGIDQAIPEK